MLPCLSADAFKWLAICVEVPEVAGHGDESAAYRVPVGGERQGVPPVAHPPREHAIHPSRTAWGVDSQQIRTGRTGVHQGPDRGGQAAALQSVTHSGQPGQGRHLHLTVDEIPPLDERKN